MLIKAEAKTREMAIKLREIKIQGIRSTGYNVTITKEWEEESDGLWYAYATVTI